tara:strand:- start:8831 stop:9445 length:615 start_codon:yes stop_codon:yes gene_type:complete
MPGYIGTRARRKKRNIYFLFFTLLLFFLIFLFFNSNYFVTSPSINIEEINSNLEDRTEEIKLLNQKISSLNNLISKEKIEKNKFVSSIKNLNNENERLLKEIDNYKENSISISEEEKINFQNKIKQLDDFIKKFKNEIKDLNFLLNEKKEQIFLLENQIKNVSKEKIDLQMQNDLILENIKELKLINREQKKLIEKLKDLTTHH